jgi:hypothetical protein
MAESTESETPNTGIEPVPWAERYPLVTGLGILLVLHTLLYLGPLQGMSPIKARAEPYFIGLVQLWYVLPLCALFALARWKRTLRVFVAGAMITFLLNLLACALFVSAMNNARW